MVTVNQYLAYAETSLVAYGRGINNLTGTPLLREYHEAGLSEAQALRFDENWLVLSQSAFSLNGFSAVLLQKRETGEKVLAVRGTNDLEDLVTDAINIALLGTVLGML